MTKIEFESALRARLSELPKREIDERIGFYIEMIDDRMEEGMSEEEAVLAVGSVDDIAVEIVADIPFVKIAKEKIKKSRKLQAWEIVLLAVGSPIWLSLAVAAFAVVISLYAVLWSLVGAAWAVFAAFAGAFLGAVALGICIIIFEDVFVGIAMIGIGLVMAGVGVFAYIGCIYATKGIVKLTKLMALGIKKCFVKKEVANG